MIPLPILADIKDVPPSFLGMAVIVLLQLSQFYFNYRKDQSREQSAKKADLSELRTEFQSEISGIATKVEALRVEFDAKIEGHREESGALHEKINSVAVAVGGLKEGQENSKITLISLGTKLDTLLLRQPNKS